MTDIPNFHEFRKSSHLSSALYDPASKTLTLTFHAGKTPYVYAQVPQSVYRTLTQRLSPGNYFHNSIEKRYDRLDKKKS